MLASGPASVQAADLTTSVEHQQSHSATSETVRGAPLRTGNPAYEPSRPTPYPAAQAWKACWETDVRTDPGQHRAHRSRTRRPR